MTINRGTNTEVWFIHTIKFCLVIKKDEITLFEEKWMQLKITILKELNPFQKSKYHVLFHVRSYTIKIHKILYM